MKLYRNHFCNDEDGSLGFDWYTAKAKAERAARCTPDLFTGHNAAIAECFEFELTKAGVLDLLLRAADHPDNG